MPTATQKGKTSHAKTKVVATKPTRRTAAGSKAAPKVQRSVPERSKAVRGRGVAAAEAKGKPGNRATHARPAARPKTARAVSRRATKAEANRVDVAQALKTMPTLDIYEKPAPADDDVYFTSTEVLKLSAFTMLTSFITGLIVGLILSR